MVFNSNVFLFLFLPLVLAVYYAGPRMFKNLWLLAGSVVFYAWGGIYTTALLVASIGMNYAFGLLVDRARNRKAARRWLGVCVVANLMPLAYFKYAGFFTETLAAGLSFWGLGSLPVVHPLLPLGISFLTFQAMSYVIDVYRGEAPVSRNPIDVALYIAFFPQLVAGPIVRYIDVAAQIRTRRHDASQFAEGVERFILGLAKKVLLANSFATAADEIFAIPGADLTAAVAWLGILCYSLQIFHDFSGYSDMAIGLGLMFGFRFVENFNYPYISRSITEFWRRWHISLSVWFRDYVYIPLGGNRCGTVRTYVNLLVVFLLCGLWHGASWNFVIWGLYYGVFLVFERIGFSAFLQRVPVVFAHGYTLLAVAGGWVLFRADDLPHAAAYYRALLGLGSGSEFDYHVDLYLDRGLIIALVAGVLGSMPCRAALGRMVQQARERSLATDRGPMPEFLYGVGRLTGVAGLLYAAAVVLSASTYSPFIYFRF